MKVHVQICPKRERRILDVHVKLIQPVGLQHPHIPHVIHGRIVLHHAGTSPDIHTQTMVDIVILEQNAVPIVGGIHPRGIIFGFPSTDVQHGILRCGIRIATTFCLVVQFHVIHGTHHVDLPGRHRHHRLVTHGGINISRLPFLGRYEDYTVRTPGTIHRRGRSILHHGKRFDILR